MKERKLNSIFKSLEQSMKSDMNINIEHNLEDGKYREYIVKNVLLKVIPSKYAITNGFVIDSNDNMSKEMDVIIYDRNYVPPFFDETYTVVPIEAVIAVIQVKTTLNSDQLENAVENVNSIDSLISKVGGKIISASDCRELPEKRNIMPYKIIISRSSVLAKKYDFDKELDSVDMIYIVDDGYKLFVKNKKSQGVVNEDKEELKIYQTKDANTEQYDNEKLLIFTLTLLDKMKLINNSIIINYNEYLKGGISNEC